MEVKRLITAVAIFGLLGVAFEQIGRYRDRHRYKQIGKSIDVGGRTLNIFCSGQGAPTVVFDTFGHESGYSWIAVQREVAKYTRACWYDRAGYGWSQLGPTPRTFEAVTSDLHVLLHKAGVSLPVVLVGAGDAASHIRVYHGRYSSEVAGVLMLNANDTDDPGVKIPDAAKGGFAKHFGSWASRVRRVACWGRPLADTIGVTRFTSLFSTPRHTLSFGLTAQQQIELDDLSDNATAHQAGEACAREESMQEVRTAGNLLDVPLMVLVSNVNDQTNFPGSDEAEWSKYRKHGVPGALASLSSASRVIPIQGDLKINEIVSAILDVLQGLGCESSLPGMRH